MSRAPATRGACGYCGQSMTGTGMRKHLESCPALKAKMAEADGKPGAAELLYHLFVRDQYNSSFWLHLEMNGSATLTKLDSYLRAIWLECCGHMSEFQVTTLGETVPKSWAASLAFGQLDQIMHLYDFGTTSETVIRVVGVRKGKPLTKHAIALMARNDMPQLPCMKCGEPAAYFCSECLIEHDKTGMLCAKHVKGHPCDNYGEPIPVVNSPRLGMCGYTGPADPPY
jgi:hypothetical protein